jgi:hypothetical protein
MAVQDNKPQIQSVLNRLAALPANILTKFAVTDGSNNTTYPLLEELLAASISWVEDQAATAFNSSAFYNTDNFELYDGNTTNQIVVRKRPVLSVQALQVVTPILGFTRVYTPQEIKTYVKQGVLKVFTYKLAVEQALLQTLDYQAWGNLFPPLPQAVQLAYTYGYPLFDPARAANPTGPATSFDGGLTWVAGDQREPEMMNWLANLQQAAICDCCAAFLGECAGLARGVIQSVSFDGYSRSLAGNPFAQELQALVQRRDMLMGRRKRQFYMATLGV